MAHQSGRHFLQIPGPTNVPDRILRAMTKPTIDHRGPEFAQLTFEVLEDLKQVLRTSSTVVLYPSSGTGAWEASLVNTLSPGDKVLMFETGFFATQWKNVAVRLGLEVDFVPGGWRHGIDPQAVESKLTDDRKHSFKAVDTRRPFVRECLNIPQFRDRLDRSVGSLRLTYPTMVFEF